jgi:isopenicillin N synthase-like dioxygenase
MNQEREKENIKHNNEQYGMFRQDSILTKVAQDYAEHMYTTGHYDHMDENGNYARARVEKYLPNINTHYAEISENLAN